jgi:hypothetical protein
MFPEAAPMLLEEKRIFEDLWECRSNGKGLFIMPRGRNWAAIKEKIKNPQS